MKQKKLPINSAHLAAAAERIAAQRAALAALAAHGQGPLKPRGRRRGQPWVTLVDTV